MTRLTKKELDDRIGETFFGYPPRKATRTDVRVIKMILRDYTESIFPAYLKPAENVDVTEISPMTLKGYRQAIDTIHQNAAKLLGDTQ